MFFGKFRQILNPHLETNIPKSSLKQFITSPVEDRQIQGQKNAAIELPRLQLTRSLDVKTVVPKTEKSKMFERLRQQLLTPELMVKATQGYTKLVGSHSKSLNAKIVEDITKLKRITQISNNSDKKRREQYFKAKRKRIDESDAFGTLESLSSEIQAYQIKNKMIQRVNKHDFIPGEQKFVFSLLKDSGSHQTVKGENHQHQI